MPESFNDRSPTPTSSPKPAREGGSQGAVNAEPSARGTAAGGLDSPRSDRKTFEAADTRPQTSSLKRTGAAVSTFKDASV